VNTVLVINKNQNSCHPPLYSRTTISSNLAIKLKPGVLKALREPLNPTLPACIPFGETVEKTKKPGQFKDCPGFLK